MRALRLTKFLILLALPFVFLYWFLYLDLVSRSPLDNSEIDRDGDGHISFMEADYAGNFETREIVKDGKICLEYRAIKDWKTLKVICE